MVMFFQTANTFLLFLLITIFIKYINQWLYIWSSKYTSYVCCFTRLMYILSFKWFLILEEWHEENEKETAQHFNASHLFDIKSTWLSSVTRSRRTRRSWQFRVIFFGSCTVRSSPQCSSTPKFKAERYSSLETVRWRLKKGLNIGE